MKSTAFDTEIMQRRKGKKRKRVREKKREIRCNFLNNECLTKKSVEELGGRSGQKIEIANFRIRRGSFPLSNGTQNGKNEHVNQRISAFGSERRKKHRN